MTNILQELKEDHRREQINNFIKNNIYTLIFIAIALVLGVAIYNFYIHKKISNAELASTELFSLVEEGKFSEKELASFKENHPPIFHAILAFKQAAKLISENKLQDAYLIYEEIAANKSLEKPIRDLATLNTAKMLVEFNEDDFIKTKISELDEKVKALDSKSSAYRIQIKEVQIADLINKNKIEEAKKIKEEILKEQDLPQSLRAKFERLSL